MSERDAFDRVLAALHEAMLDEAHWAAASALIDKACGIKGNELVVSGWKPSDDPDIFFARFCYRGQRREAWERSYFRTYQRHDERVPRLRQLADSRIVRVTDLYTEEELKTSRAYNEALRHSGGQNGLNVRMDGPDGSSCIVFSTTDPIEPGGWSSTQVETVERLLPHIRQFVRVRQTLASAEALGTSHTAMLDNTGVGVIHLDRDGRVVAANDRARDILRRGDGLSDRDGLLHAPLPTDRTRLEQLLARALPTFGSPASGGSITVRRASGLPSFTLHVSPVAFREFNFGAQGIAALVLIVDPDSRTRMDLNSQGLIDPRRVAAVLGLTRAESEVAAALAEGWSVRDIATGTDRKESSIRWHIKQIYRKQGISRQTELVRRVLSIGGL